MLNRDGARNDLPSEGPRKSGPSPTEFRAGHVACVLIRVQAVAATTQPNGQSKQANEHQKGNKQAQKNKTATRTEQQRKRGTDTKGDTGRQTEKARQRLTQKRTQTQIDADRQKTVESQEGEIKIMKCSRCDLVVKLQI